MVGREALGDPVSTDTYVYVSLGGRRPAESGHVECEPVREDARAPHSVQRGDNETHGLYARIGNGDGGAGGEVIREYLELGRCSLC
jgi:hypothetical protein